MLILVDVSTAEVHVGCPSFLSSWLGLICFIIILIMVVVSPSLSKSLNSRKVKGVCFKIASALFGVVACYMSLNLFAIIFCEFLASLQGGGGLSGMMIATQRSLSDARTSIEKKLENVYSSVSASSLFHISS